MCAATQIKNNKVLNQVILATEGLSKNELAEVLDFVYFIKAKKVIDPSQAYFWTKKWQEWEREADEDKKAGRVKTFNSVDELITDLHRGEND